MKCYLPFRNLNITLKKAKARAGALAHELVLFVIVAIICLYQIFCQRSKDVPATTQNLFRLCLKCYLLSRNLNITLKKSKSTSWCFDAQAGAFYNCGYYLPSPNLLPRVQRCTSNNPESIKVLFEVLLAF